MIQLLTFTDLFPNPAQPRHGIFVENRLRQLIGTGEFSARVIAPISWPRLSRMRTHDRQPVGVIPKRHVRDGIEVFYPRYPVVRGLSNWLNPTSMSLAVRRSVNELLQAGFRADVIDAHFFYPAGVAAINLGRRLGVPVVITARGSDINVHTNYRIQRARILWAADRAAAVVTVSAALRDCLVKLGVPRDKITVVRNGVDLNMFQPGDRVAIRRSLGVNGQTLLSVGNLVTEKGHELVIESLTHLPDTRLIVVGDGPLDSQLKNMAIRTGVANRITWIPNLSQPELARYFAAADFTILASSREGMANVILESLACGTRVIASRVGDNDEILQTMTAGMLLGTRSAVDIAGCVRELAAKPLAREQTRVVGETFSWSEPISLLSELLRGVARGLT